MNGKRRTTEDFINDSQLIHGDKYEYSKSIFTKRKSKVIIICPIHGEFEQTACSHLSGKGCDKCAHEKLDGKRRKPLNEFIKEALIIHSNVYDYSKSNYTNWRNKVEIICPKHGSFFQSPHNHLKGHGCNKCRGGISKPEIELTNFIKSFYKGIVLNNDRTVLKPNELDIYLPEINLAIEYNGEYWHSISQSKVNRDDKSYRCLLKGITLIHIEEVDWKANKKYIMHNLKNLILE